MVQWVGYEGVLTPHELYFGAGPAAFGAFAKRRSRLVEELLPSFFVPSDALRAFAARHGFALYDEEAEDYEPPTQRRLMPALRKESDRFVAELLGEYSADDDAEGSYSTLLRLKNADFLGLPKVGREAWFAPVLAGKEKLFEVCTSRGYLDARSTLLRARAREGVFAALLQDEEHPLHEDAMAAVLSRYAHCAGASLPDKPAARRREVARATPRELCERFEYCYDKSCFVSLSVREVRPPYLLDAK